MDLYGMAAPKERQPGVGFRALRPTDGRCLLQPRQGTTEDNTTEDGTAAKHMHML